MRSAAACVVRELALYSVDIMRAFAVAGAIPALVVLLSSPSAAVQGAAAGALRNLGVNNENKVAIATAGAIRPLIALLKSPSAAVKAAAAGTLRVLGVDASTR